MNQPSQDRVSPDDWRRGHRALPQSPLYPILGRHVFELSQLNEAGLNRLRRHALIKTPRLDCGDMDSFFVDLIADTEILWSLFRPTPRYVVLQGRDVLRKELPFDSALKAADRAYRSQLLQPHERAPAWLAGFAWSVGANAAARACLGAIEPASKLRSLLLEEPLANLGRRNAPLARTLAAALECADMDECDVAQVARISTAARSANLFLTLN